MREIVKFNIGSPEVCRAETRPTTADLTCPQADQFLSNQAIPALEQGYLAWPAVAIEPILAWPALDRYKVIRPV